MSKNSYQKSFRVEVDSMGQVNVPSDKYWGAQTQRALQHFPAGKDVMPYEVIYALAIIKKCAAIVNSFYGKISKEKADLIINAADEVISGKLDEHFPLAVWQSGSGTQSNMNVNEVIANRAIEMAGGILGSKSPVHPNDDVNMSQSTNDVFTSAMHIASVLKITKKLLPAIHNLRSGLNEKSKKYEKLVKVGRTHLQDAVPITLGQEISGWVAQIDFGYRKIDESLKDVYELAIGGTAVGTGLNSPMGFAEKMAEQIGDETDLPFMSAKNKFAQLAAHDALVEASSALRLFACSIMKIANDIRWLSSGPRCGLGELHIPTNEPGSSMMPGKVNPTQCEAMMMVCCQLIGNDTVIAMADSQGNFELNTFKPVIVFNMLNSIDVLTGACDTFYKFCVVGIRPNVKRIDEMVSNSLMLVTALAPKIGYDKAAEIAQKAYSEGTSLKEAALKLDYLTAEEYDIIVKPELMVHPNEIR
jgi:fumarate hydratase, class II